MARTAARCVVFDFDGTIADTFAAFVDVYNTIIAPSLGSRPYDSRDAERIRTVPLGELIREYGIPRLQLPLLVLRARRELSRRIPDIAVCAGMADTLRRLHEAGATLGILTTNSRANVHRFLESHRLTGVFDVVRTRRDPFGKARALRGLIRSLDRIAAPPVYVGDEGRDVRAGKAAGARTVAVTWGLSGPQALARERPDALVSTAEQLMSAVDALTANR